MNAKRALFSMIFVLTLVVAGFAVASSRNGASSEGSEVRQTELPREWVWKKQTKSFDDMYRR